MRDGYGRNCGRRRTARADARLADGRRGNGDRDPVAGTGFARRPVFLLLPPPADIAAGASLADLAGADDPRPRMAAIAAVLERLSGEWRSSMIRPKVRGRPHAESYETWTVLVDRIRTGEEDSMQELYDLFLSGIRFYLCRQLGKQELDDKLHDTFVLVVQAIRKGELREPERLMGFVRTIVRRMVAAHIDRAIHLRRDQIDVDSGIRIVDPASNPEDVVIFEQRLKIIQQ